MLHGWARIFQTKKPATAGRVVQAWTREFRAQGTGEWVVSGGRLLADQRFLASLFGTRESGGLVLDVPQHRQDGVLVVRQLDVVAHVLRDLDGPEGRPAHACDLLTQAGVVPDSTDVGAVDGAAQALGVPEDLQHGVVARRREAEREDLPGDVPEHEAHGQRVDHDGSDALHLVHLPVTRWCSGSKLI